MSVGNPSGWLLLPASCCDGFDPRAPVQGATGVRNPQLFGSFWIMRTKREDIEMKTVRLSRLLCGARTAGQFGRGKMFMAGAVMAFLFGVPVVSFGQAQRGMEIVPYDRNEDVPVRLQFVVRMGTSIPQAAGGMQITEIDPETQKPLGPAVGQAAPSVVTLDALLSGKQQVQGRNPLRVVFLPVFEARNKIEEGRISKFANDNAVQRIVDDLLVTGAAVQGYSPSTNKYVAVSSGKDFAATLQQCGSGAEMVMKFPSLLQSVLSNLDQEAIAGDVFKQKSLLVVLWMENDFRYASTDPEIVNVHNCLSIVNIHNRNQLGVANPVDRPVGMLKSLRVKNGFFYRGVSFGKGVPGYGELLKAALFNEDATKQLSRYGILTVGSNYGGLSLKRTFEIRVGNEAQVISAEITPAQAAKLQEQRLAQATDEITGATKKGDYEGAVATARKAVGSGGLDAERQKAIWHRLGSELEAMLKAWLPNSLDRAGKLVAYVDQNIPEVKGRLAALGNDYLYAHGRSLLASKELKDFQQGVAVLNDWKKADAATGRGVEKRLAAIETIVRAALARSEDVNNIIEEQMRDATAVSPKFVETMSPQVAEWLARDVDQLVLSKKISALPEIRLAQVALADLAKKGEASAMTAATQLALILGDPSAALERAEKQYLSAGKPEDYTAAFLQFVPLMRLSAALAFIDAVETLDKGGQLTGQQLLDCLTDVGGKYVLGDWKRNTDWKLVAPAEVQGLDAGFVTKALNAGYNRLIVTQPATTNTAAQFQCYYPTRGGGLLRLNVKGAARTEQFDQFRRSNVVSPERARFCRIYEFPEWRDTFLASMSLVASACYLNPPGNPDLLWNQIAQRLPETRRRYAAFLKPDGDGALPVWSLPDQLDEQILTNQFLNRAQSDVMDDRSNSAVMELVVPVFEKVSKEGEPLRRRRVGLLRAGLPVPSGASSAQAAADRSAGAQAGESKSATK